MGRFKITKDSADIDCRVKIAENKEADGTIVRQKGAKKFLVTDGTNTGICVLSDLDDNNLANGTMTVCIESDGKDIRLEYLSNKYGVDFNGNRYALSVSDSTVLENCKPANLKTGKKSTVETKKETSKPKPTAKKKPTKKKPTAKKKPVAKKSTKKPILKSVPKVEPSEPKVNDAIKTTSDYSIELD